VDQISYNAAISSCQRAALWRAALAILQDMAMEPLGLGDQFDQLDRF
jgi:pentatricopeptide repeat protein